MSTTAGSPVDQPVGGHLEVYYGVADGMMITVVCHCDMARNHTHLEYRLAHADESERTADVVRSLRRWVADRRDTARRAKEARVAEQAPRPRGSAVGISLQTAGEEAR